MKITPITDIGANRPLCRAQVRVATGLRTNEAKRNAANRQARGIPIDQCGRRADFMLDGAPRCRGHAGANALAYLLREGAPPPRTYRPMETAPRDRELMLRLPQGGEQRAVWWNSWHDPADPKPWAWRQVLSPTAVGFPITAASGWREVERSE